MKYLGKKAKVISTGGMVTDLEVGDIVTIGACDYEEDQAVAVTGHGDWGYVEGDIDYDNVKKEMSTVVEGHYRVID